MKFEIEDKLFKEVCELQSRREELVQYPNSIRWLALAKNIGESFDCYFRQDGHYKKELADSLINILMILELDNIDINNLIHDFLEKTKIAIVNTPVPLQK